MIRRVIRRLIRRIAISQFELTNKSSGLPVTDVAANITFPLNEPPAPVDYPKGNCNDFEMPKQCTEARRYVWP